MNIVTKHSETELIQLQHYVSSLIWDIIRWTTVEEGDTLINNINIPKFPQCVWIFWRIWFSKFSIIRLQNYLILNKGIFNKFSNARSTFCVPLEKNWFIKSKCKRYKSWKTPRQVFIKGFDQIQVYFSFSKLKNIASSNIYTKIDYFKPDGSVTNKSYIVLNGKKTADLTEGHFFRKIQA